MLANTRSNYFSLEVKTHRKDLFDREEELKTLEASLNDPITVVMGMRRLGKSSLVAVALEETEKISMTVDLRGVGPNPSPVKVMQRFETAINSVKSKGLWEKLSKISGVSLFSFGIQFSRASTERPGLQAMLDSMQDYANENEKQLIIAVDEVQDARGLPELQAAFAHIYDYAKNIRLVLAGSEVGVLHDFLDLDNPEAYLYGRKINFVELQKFPRERSLQFLKAGFEVYGKQPSSNELEQAVNRLDGIVGWLVLYGHDVVSHKEKPDLQAIVNQAMKMVEAESAKRIARSKHYRYILRALSNGEMRWKNILDYLELNEGYVSESAFTDSLTYLTKYGLVQKNAKEDTYALPDPITAEYSKTL